MIVDFPAPHYHFTTCSRKQLYCFVAYVARLDTAGSLYASAYYDKCKTVSTILSAAKGLYIKDVCSQEGEVCLVWTRKEEGLFRCGGPHSSDQNTSDFSKFMVSSLGQRELSQCGHFVDNVW